MARQYKISIEDFADIYNDSNSIPEVKRKIHAQFNEEISTATVYRLKDRCRAFRRKLRPFVKTNKLVAAFIAAAENEANTANLEAEQQDLGIKPEVNSGSYEHANEE